MFMTYAKLGWMTDDYQLMRTLDILGQIGGMGMVHAENGLATDYLQDKTNEAGDDPLDLRVTVMKALPRLMQTFGSSTNRVGDAVWVRADNDVDIVLNSVRTQVLHPDAFTQLGIDLGAKKLVIVKSTQHFYAGFAPIAAEVIYVNADGAIPKNFADIAYTKRKTAYWPKVADPWTA